ncbi:CobW family GTP-binding protein [Caproicibacterium amylolyticum]|uniref:GTP-binding protein n=1 Tax=Caproicibacterium amylolyticum TaxID=2766537 RepID=A0A7G9WF36_9FIRM|nr:GTP-binding protein [Caproicibacterium amylolyticum]QNO17298.1 GTP-binding protein [Caproicibacterium amylolyticum]
MSKEVGAGKKPVVLLTGYLGSGKTTVLNELLKNEMGRKIAVIVNDIGSINIDAGILKNGGTAAEKEEMIELQNGCICCTLQNQFMKEIDRLAGSPEIEAVFVEASGVSNPENIAEGFQVYEEMMPQSPIYLSSVVTVADADRIYTEFLGKMEAAEAGDETEEDPDIINLVMDQIEYCGLIILNKCDLLSRGQIDRVKKVLQELQPEAEIVEAVQGKVNPSAILNCGRFDYEKAGRSSLVSRTLNSSAGAQETDTDCGITSFLFEERRPFDYDRFSDFLQNDYPEEIIRAKGYVWFADDDIHVQLFEQAGRNASVTEVSNWVCALPKESQQEILREHPNAMDDWDETYGDRMNQIVFIGRGYEKSAILRQLKKCLSK